MSDTFHSYNKLEFLFNYYRDQLITETEKL